MRGRSQSVQADLRSVLFMEEKYYTHFLLVDGEAQGGYSEFSGIVQVMRHNDGSFADHEVRRLLAENFEVEIDDITLLQWSRLH